MIRKFNYTGRLKIDRSRVVIRIIRRPDGTPSGFDCSLDIADYGLPESADVFVEAHYRSWFRRVSFGTVGKQVRPSDTDLSEAGVQQVIFGVKIVDGSGKILAEANNILPEDVESSIADRRCILPIIYSSDLGERVWRVEYQAGVTPTLEVNVNMPKIEQQVKEFVTTPRFAPVAFSAALEELLTQIVEGGLGDEDGDSPESLWLRFVRGFYDAPPPAGTDPEKVRDWVKGAVGAFTEVHKFATKYGEFFGEQVRND